MGVAPFPNQILDVNYTPREAPRAYGPANRPLLSCDQECCSVTTPQSLPPWSLPLPRQQGPVWSAPIVRSGHEAYTHLPWFIPLRSGPSASATSKVAIPSSRPRGQLDISAGGIGYPHLIEVLVAYAMWVASQNTLLKTNGSHERCTIYFAHFIQRPLICLRPFKAMQGFENPSLSLPKTFQRKTFDFLRPENAMRSPPPALAPRERIFSSELRKTPCLSENVRPRSAFSSMRAGGSVMRTMAGE